MGQTPTVEPIPSERVENTEATPEPRPEPRWRDLGPEEDLPTDGGGLTYEVDGRAIAVFRVDGELFAISDTCPHSGASLGMGVVVDGEIACPWHSFHFDLKTGANTDGLACRVRVYPVRRSAGGRVEVEWPR